ncbi:MULTISPECIES: hypothetical protein [unclassified Streptomyces]|uniref:hypothetical protein n=1 Tax=unclassified Streptomyces TaxID=2593676 RepID=UPI00225AA6F5|nr:MULTISPECIES: hypothetical protein [unclassified Streptomyces]MCX4632528.1 hypothetical protein [Streptomyces sp. NBC_01443]WSW49254.1 hypothetical protein OG296_39940 [Streptomyces sp. NBC_01001]
MTATRIRRTVPLLIATLLAGGGVSLSSTAFATPTTTTASVHTDTDTDNLRTVKRLTKKPRLVKKLTRTVEKDDVGVSQPSGDPYNNVNVDGTTRVPQYHTTPCVTLDCVRST